MGLDPGALNIERIRNSDAFVWQMQREGANAGGQLKSERGLAEASGVRYKDERANEAQLNALSFLSGGLIDVVEGGRRLVAGEGWESAMDTQSGRMASLIGDRLGIGSGETARRSGFGVSQDDPGIADASNFDLALRSVSAAIGGKNALLTQAGTGRSTRNLSGVTRGVNAATDFAQEMVLSIVGGGAIAGPGKTLLGTLGRGFVAENVFDAPDYIQMVKAKGFVEGTKEFTLALMNQFNPAVLFDPNREVEEKVITGISLALLGLGKGADIAITKANSQVMDKAWGEADLGEVRKHLESAAFDMLRKTNVTSLLPGDIRKQAKYVAFQYLNMGTEIYGDNVQVGQFLEAATTAMKNGSLETVVKQAMSDAEAKVEVAEAGQAQVAQEVDEGVGADEVLADLAQGQDVSLSGAQWKGLGGELAEALLQIGAVADEDANGDVTIRAPKADSSRVESQTGQAQPTSPSPVEGVGLPVERDVTEPIGKNMFGQDVYESADGVRSYSRDGFRISEPVAVTPTRGGMQASIVNRRDEFKTTDEIGEGDAVKTSLAEGDRVTQTKDGYEVGRDDTAPIRKKGNRYEASAMATGVRSTKGVAFRPKDQTEWRALNALVEDGIVRKFDRDRDGDYDYAHGISTSFVLTDVGEKWAQTVGYDFRTDHRHMKRHADRLRSKANDAMESGAPGANELDHKAGEAEIAYADAIWETGERLNAGENLPDDAKITNRIDPDAKPSEKLAQLAKLSDENESIIRAILDKMAQGGVKGGLSRKMPHRILQKSMRPSILAAKPWHRMEHIRDSLRFKIISLSFEDIVTFAELLPPGAEVIKVDFQKMFNPGVWGWRFWGVDLRMPNGQIVEMYMPLQEVEAAKREGHKIFEKWRNLTKQELAERAVEYEADIHKSWTLYESAFHAALTRMGYLKGDSLNIEEALKDFTMASERASAVILSKLSKSSAPIGASVQSDDPAGNQPMADRSRDWTSTRPSDDSNTRNSGLNNIEDTTHIIDVSESRRVQSHRLPPSGSKMNLGSKFTGGTPEENEVEAKLRRIVKSLDADSIYDQIPSTHGGKIIGTDNARELSPEYASGKEGAEKFTKATAKLASAYAKDRLVRELQNRGDRQTIVFTSGGVAAGKTTVIDPSTIADADLVYDGLMRNATEAVAMIQLAVDNGWKVHVSHVHRPIANVIKSAVLRAERIGRWGPVAELPLTHIQSQRMFAVVANEFRDSARVTLDVLFNGWVDESATQEWSGPVDLARVLEGGDLWHNESEAVHETERAWQEIVDSGRFPREFLSRLAQPVAGGPALSAGVEQANQHGDGRSAERGKSEERQPPVTDSTNQQEASAEQAGASSYSEGDQVRQRQNGETRTGVITGVNGTTVTVRWSGQGSGTEYTNPAGDRIMVTKKADPAPSKDQPKRIVSDDAMAQALKDLMDDGPPAAAGAGLGALASFSPKKVKALIVLAVGYIERGVSSVVELLAKFAEQGVTLTEDQALEAYDFAADVIDGVMDIEAVDTLAGILTQESDGQASQLPPSGTGSPTQVQPDDGVRNDEDRTARVRTGPRDSGRADQGSTRSRETDDAAGGGVVRDVGDSKAPDGRANADDGARGSGSGRAGQFRLPESSGEPIPPTNAGKAKALVAALEARRDARDRGWATAEEQAAMIAFPGWGFSKNWFQPGTKEYDSDRGATIRDLTTKDEAIAARLASRNSHYTSVSVVKAMHSALEHLGITDGAGLNVLEPSVGSGLFYAAAPDGLAGANWSMVELDETTAEIAKFLYPESDVQQTAFQKTRFKSGSFNLVISNVPFSEVGVFDGQMSEQLGEKAAEPLMKRLHNYFFAKSVDLTAPGGIIAFITTNGSLDASDDIAKHFRQFMHENTEFLGAVRLPNNAFGDSANTEVVTDIIILRRRGHGGAEIENAFLKARPTKVGGETYMINEWFLKHPSAVLGEHASTGSMHSANEYTVTPKYGTDLAKEITKAFRRQLPKDAFIRTDVPADVKLPRVEVPPGTQVGEVFLDSTNALMRLSPNGTVEAMSLTVNQEKVFRDYLDVKSALNVVLHAQTASDAELKSAQSKLAKAYDKFVKAHGHLQEAKTSERVKLKDKKPVLDSDGDPVTTTTVSFKHKALLGRDSQSARVMALEVWDFDNYKVKGKADIFTKRTILMEQAVKNLSDPQDLLNASLNVKGKIDIDWMRQVTEKSEEDVVNLLGDLVIKDPAGGYSDRQEYLSGNIRQKLNIAKAAAINRPEFAQNVKLLESVMPEPKEYQDVAAEFGAKWIPDSVYDAFFASEFPRSWGSGAGLKVLRRQSAGWEVENLGVSSAAITNYGVAMRMDTFIQHVMNRTTPKIYSKVGESRVLDKNATDFAIDKAREVREKFTAWLDSNAEHQATVTDAFNTEINVFVPLQRGAAHLTFEGLNVSDTGVQLRPHRLNAISMAMAKPFTLWWHGVGSGKTFTATMLAMKLKQTGLRNKVVIVTYKPTLEQFIADAYVAYPNARILAAHEKSFSAENRTEFLASMATGDWDMIVITQEQLASLPLSPEKTHELFTDLVEAEIAKTDFRSEEEVEKKAKGRGAAGKLAKRIEAIMLARDTAVSAAEKRMSSGSLAFDSIGIDHLIVDEAHMYKGLPVTTETDIGLSESQRAMDLYVKVSYLRTQKGGMTAMTGTALVNSSAEIYNWLRILDPETLAQIGGSEFDDFATNFLRMDSEIEVGVSGSFKSRSRVRGIVSLPVLAEAFAQTVDVVPTHEVVTLPTLVGGKPFVHVTQPDDAQKHAFADIAARYQEIKDNIAKGNYPGPGDDNFLSLSTRGRLASQDARFYFPNASDSGTSKATMIADNVADIYRRFHEDKAAQIIFMDFGIPGKGFDAYNDMVKKLAARGIPKGEIAMISDARNAQDRARIAARVRSGEVRVLIGSRAKLGVGLNIQARLIAVHHQAIGWNPAMLEQGNARIIRYGNRYKEVEVHYYVVAGTYDQITGNATMAKGNVFTQLVNGMSARSLGREMDEAVTEEGANSMAEVMAVAMGDPRIVQMVQLAKDFDRALARHTQAERSLKVSEGQAELYESTLIPAAKSRLDAMQALHGRYREDPDAKFQLNGVEELPQAGGEAGVLIMQEAARTGNGPIGQIGDFTVRAHTTIEGRSYRVTLRIDGIDDDVASFLVEDDFAPTKDETFVQRIRGYIAGKYNQIPGMADHARQALDASVGNHRQFVEQVKKGVPESYVKEVDDLRQKLSRLEFDTDLSVKSLESGEVSGFGIEPAQPIRVDKTVELGGEKYEVLERSRSGAFWVRKPDGKEAHFKVDHPLRPQIQNVLDGKDPMDGITVEPEESEGESESYVAQLNLRTRPQLNLPNLQASQAAATIPIAPITGQRPKRKDQIILDLNKALGSRKAVMGTAGKATVGNYLPRSRSRWIRGTTDLVTTSHELMHEVDDRFGVFAEWARGTEPFPADIDAELQRPEFQGSVAEGMPAWQVRAEQLAEWGRALIMNPDATRSLTPNLSAHWDEKVPQRARDAIMAFSDDLRAFAGATGREAIIASMDTALDGETGKGLASWWNRRLDDYERFRRETTGEDGEGNFRTTVQDRFRVKLIDEWAPAASVFREVFRRRGLGKGKTVNPDLPAELDDKENPNVWMRRLPYLDQIMSGFIDHGFEDINGQPITGSVAEMFAELDNTSPEAFARDFEDMSALLMAERQIELGERIEKRADQEIAEATAALYEKFDARIEAYGNRLNRELKVWLDGALAQLAKGTNKAIKETPNDDTRSKSERRILDKAAKEEKALRDRAKKAFKAGMQKYTEGATLRLKRQVDSVTEKIRSAARFETQGQFAMGADGIRVAMRDARDTIKELEMDAARYVRLKEAARRYREFGDWTLQTLVDHGLLSEADRITIRDANQYWFSAQRVMDDDVLPFIRSAAGLSGAKPPVKKKGMSGRITSNVVDNLLEQMYNTLSEATRNSVLRTWTDIMSPSREMYSPNDPDFADIATELPEGADPTPTTITFYRDGKKELWDVTDKALYETLARIGKGADDAETRFMLNVLAMPTSVLRNTITMTPAFALRNLGRDTETRMVTNPYRNSARSFAPRMPDQEMKRVFATHALGAGRGTHLSDADNFAKVRQESIRQILVANGNAKAKVRHLLTWGPRSYMRLLEAAEKKNRSEVYHAAYDYAIRILGRDAESAKLYAAHEARSTMTDFRRAGQWSRKLNRFIPFFNAAIQGQSASWTKIAQNPAKSLTRLMVWSTIMISLERAWASMMDDDEDREQTDPMQRDLFFRFKVDDDLYVSVPKPHDLGLVTSAIDRLVDYLGGDQHAFEGAAARAFNVMSPAGLDDALGPAKVAAELGWNRNFFTGNSIVSPYEEHKEIDLRKGTAYASPLGKQFAQYLGGDPRQWDHVLRGQFGNVGRAAIDISRTAAGERAPGTMVSLTGLAANAPMYGARDVQWVLKTAKANGIGKTKLDEMQDQYFDARDAATRDKLAGEIVKYAKALRVKMEAAMAGKSGEKRAEALREVVSAAKKDQKGAGTFSAPKFALPKFKINSP